MPSGVLCSFRDRDEPGRNRSRFCHVSGLDDPGGILLGQVPAGKVEKLPGDRISCFPGDRIGCFPGNRTASMHNDISRALCTVYYR